MGNYLAGVNPLTRIALMILVTTPLLLSVDWVSALVSLALTVVLAPACGVAWRDLAKVALPLCLVVPLSGVSMLLYGAPGGEEYFSWWLIKVTENSVELAIAMMFRVFAVALPVVVLARGIEPTSLGDALAQILKLPERFVIGAVAGVRMLTLFKDDWDSMERSRRARGLTDVSSIKHLMTMTFGLLVLALRRGGKLATAMEARGYGRAPAYGERRTWARESVMTARDSWVIAVGVCVAAVPVVISVAVGSWRFFGL